MTSYFDEHDCEPLGANERPNNQLHLARLLLDSGIATALNLNFESLGGRDLPPSTSKTWLKNEFPKYCFSETQQAGFQCPICLKEFQSKEETNDTETKSACTLPGCGHSFHCECLSVWLERTCSCPLCRHELPTDDPNYEEFKRQRKREKIREQDIADLHNSMFT